MGNAERLVYGWWYDEAQFCGCGNSHLLLGQILDGLKQHRPPADDFALPAYEWVHQNLLMAYVFDAWKLTEHGGSVYGAWLTDKGVALRDALETVDRDTVLDLDGGGVPDDEEAP